VNKSADSVIIMAAGDGARLNSSTPKVFHKIGGLSLLGHVISNAKKINPMEIIVVVKPSHENLVAQFGTDIKIATQAIPLGTGDTVRCGLSAAVADDLGWVYILYGDIPLVSSETLEQLSKISEECDKTGVVVLAMDADNSQKLGKLEFDEKSGALNGIVEERDSSESDITTSLCNTGLLVKKSLLRQFVNEMKPSKTTGELYITGVVKMARESGYLCRYHRGDAKELSGVNTREELALLEKYFQDKMRQQCLGNGATLVAPETVFFSHDTVVEKDVLIHPYVVFLKNVHIKTGAEIGPFCVVEGSHVHSAKVGPFARLRPESKIEDGARVGNFVEIKNSIVAENAKINHLSYVGDSDIGKNSNIGAGTITCNYDGRDKHKTFVGENVFIGSNAALVAPVKICDNATVGAGSVITRDVEKEALAIARGIQRNIKKWPKNPRNPKGKSKCAES
jgi:bifunctional UDP-N-acetylglucosamine pyrophosphorylase/glucosamine-1-phosphate N-acetyltransferase